MLQRGFCFRRLVDCALGQPASRREEAVNSQDPVEIWIVSNLDAGGPSTCCRLEVDEEPPGSPVNLFACPPSSQAPRPHWRQVFPGREFFVHSAHVSRAPRSSPQTRAFRRAFYRDISDKHWNDWRWQARHRICTLGQLEQMLVLSEEEREAAVAGRGDAALQHHPLLHEPDFPGRSAAAAPPHRRPHGPRAGPLRRRGRRSLGRRTRHPRAGPGPSLSGPGAAAGAGFVLELLPLLHPLAGGGAAAKSSPTRNAWNWPSTISGGRPPSATCSSPAAIRCCSASSGWTGC